MRLLFLCSFVLTILFAGIQVRARDKDSDRGEPIPVDSVDLGKYAGTWYEIARIPNSFQSKCAMNTTATYVLRKDGRIDVLNRCVGSDGKVNVAKGVAEVVDAKTTAKLKVSFVKILGINLFWGDYWVIGLDREYRYAVVGTPSRKYGWILSRTQTLSNEEREAIDNILIKQGYDPEDFVPTEQTASDPDHQQH